MTGKLSLAAVAVAFAMMTMPTSASAHFSKRDWCRKDCMFGWMYQWHCKKKVVHKRYVHKRSKKVTK